MGRYDFPRRKCVRLRDYDYSRAGAYFVTICVDGKRCIFGRVDKAEMNLSPIGNICADRCLRILDRFPGVEVDCFVVMPNHMHAIIVLPDRTEYPNLHNHRRGAAVSPVHDEISSPANDADSIRRGAVPSPAVRVDTVPPSVIPSPVVKVGSLPPNENSRLRKGAVLMPLIAHPRQHLGRIVAWYKYLTTKSVTELNGGKLTRFWQRGYHDHIIRDENDLRMIREYIENNPLKWELDRYYRMQ